MFALSFACNSVFSLSCPQKKKAGKRGTEKTQLIWPQAQKTQAKFDSYGQIAAGFSLNNAKLIPLCSRQQSEWRKAWPLEPEELHSPHPHPHPSTFLLSPSTF
jgi:hypothetical protein